MACQDPFGMLKRKHHCRGCGRIFCGGCSAYLLELHSKVWSNDAAIVANFRERFKCAHDPEHHKFTMRLCRACFGSDLNDQLSQLYDEDGFAQNLRQSFILNETRMRQHTLNEARRFALHDTIFREAVKLVHTEVGQTIEHPGTRGKTNWAEEYVTDLFIHFNTLLEHRLDFNTVDIADLIPVCPLRLPKVQSRVLPRTHPGVGHDQRGDLPEPQEPAGHPVRPPALLQAHPEPGRPHRLPVLGAD